MAGTFRDLIDEVLDLGSHGTGDDFEGMVKAAINRTYRRVLQKTRQERLSLLVCEFLYNY